MNTRRANVTDHSVAVRAETFMRHPMIRSAADMEAPNDGGGGEAATWDSIWSRTTGDEGEIYRRGSVQTLRQFWLRCYSEDLWAALEPVRRERGEPLRCVELGAGRGTLSKYLRRHDCEVTLVDLSEHARTLATASFERDGFGAVDYVIADVRDSGLPSGSFDCVLSVGVLEHFEDPLPMLRESMRLLRPGGLMFHVIVPSVPPSRAYLVKLLLAPWRLAGTLAKQHLVPGRSGAKPIYRTNYPRADYQRWVEALGGHEVSCVPYNPYHRAYASALLERWIALPSYGLHHALKRRLAPGPALRTRPELALCDLLLARRP